MPAKGSRSPSLQREVRRLYDLLEVAKTVFSTLELKAALEAVLQSSLRLSHTIAGCIALYDEERQELTLCAHQGLDDASLARRTWLVKSRDLTARLLKKRQPFVVTGKTQAKFFSEPSWISPRVCSTACVPLVFQNQVIGILYVNNLSPRAFTAEERHALEVLAAFAAMAINHARVHAFTREMARTDELTGLHNYRYFQERLGEETARAKRYGRVLSLIMIDVDNFKQVNDTYGHLLGNQLLQKIASIIKDSIREMDIPSRYGGEEFTILLPEANTSQAFVVAERIRRHVEELTPGHLGIGPQEARISLGIASFPTHAQDKDRFLTCADEALYQAKMRGKNCTVCFETQPSGQPEVPNQAPGKSFRSI